MHRMRRIAALASFTLTVAACGTIKPVPYTPEEVQARLAEDRQRMYADQEPVTGPVTFYEAAARALKYNLDYRLKLMESALAQSLRDVARYEMLPDLVASAGYAWRNNDSGGTSVSIPTGVETLSPSTSQERNRRLAGLALSWNVLDFGVSYYRAKQKADQMLMAEERRRKVAQTVLEDVRNAWWRALGAQRLIADLDRLLGRVNGALATASAVESKGLMPRPQVLAYERTLLDAVNLLTLRRQDLELSQNELAALMSLPPGTRIELSETSEQSLPPVPVDMESLERIALERRPEIMEEWYRKRVTENDIKVAKAALWPNLSIDAAPQYDSNKYLYNNNWIESGLLVSFNLLKLAQLPALEAAHENQLKTDDMRRLSLSMAVLTQVRLGVQRYELALSELKYAEDSLRVDEKLHDYGKAAVATSLDSELELIRAEARWLLSRYQRQSSYSNAQAAWGRLYNSIGLDVLPGSIASSDVKGLAAEIERTMNQWQQTAFRVAAL